MKIDNGEEDHGDDDGVSVNDDDDDDESKCHYEGDCDDHPDEKSCWGVSPWMDTSQSRALLSLLPLLSPNGWHGGISDGI